MADLIYNSFKRDIANGPIDLDTDTIKVTLFTSSYTPNADSHDNLDDVTDEASGTGYTAGGQALAKKTVSADNTDDEGILDADEVTWSSSTTTAQGAVFYRGIGTPSTFKLIKFITIGSGSLPVDQLARHIDDSSH